MKKILLFCIAGLFITALSADESYSPLNKPVAELSADMAADKTSALDISRFYLARIKQLNPSYNAVISTNPNAEAIAIELDKERAAGKLRGPLHGIPVLLKDNINSSDPMPTTAGSLALKENFASEDAPLVKSLRAAGAIILGKANLSEWANMRSTKSISGWSAIGGFTRNSWNRDMNPCGSSSGSAVSAALNLAPLTVGSETDGSILCPSSMNGVVGFKPTAGMVSQHGIVPISHSQDTAGPITRSVADAVALLQGMLTEGAAIKPEDLQAALDKASLKGLKIGVSKTATGYNDLVDKTFTSALKTLEAAGAVLVDISDSLSIKELAELEAPRLLIDMKADMQAYLKDAPAAVKVRNIADLVAFNKANKEIEMKYFAQEFFEIIETLPALDSKEYQQINAQIKQLIANKGIEAILKNNQVDLLVAPTSGVAGPLKDERNSATKLQPGSSQSSAMAGLPSITVPMGIIKGMPLGISFMAGKNSEPVLIRAAASFEAARGDFGKPQIDTE